MLINLDLYKFLKKESNNIKENHVKWISLLTQDCPEEIERFKDYLKISKKKTGSAIVKYRDYLLKETCRGKVELDNLINHFNTENYDELKKLLQELFLQYIDDSTFAYIMKKIHSKELLEKLYNLHKAQPRKCIEKLI